MQPLIDIVGEFRAVVQTLSTHRLGFAVCGGFAVAIHGHPRATKDIDLLVEAAAIEPAFAALRTLSFNLRAGPIDFGFGTVNARTMFRATKVVGNDYLTIDLLSVSPVYASVWASRELIDWGGLKVPIVSRVGLATMKTLAGRKQDLADLEALGIEVTPGGMK